MLRSAALVMALAAGTVSVAAVPALAATPAHPVGVVDHATQDTATHRLRVSGWAYDSATASASITVRIYADGRYVGQARTTHPSPKLDALRHLKGQHDYVFSLSYPTWAKTVTVRSAGASTSSPLLAVGTHAVTRVHSSASDRIIAVAKRYVGKVRFVDDGASPKTGFDCSGYTKYVYAVADVATLPHNADAQMRMSRMHRVSARKALPGDLVFYLSGSRAYHVAIYAGHHKQYAAATTRDGVRYQNVWSSDVVYGHYR